MKDSDFEPLHRHRGPFTVHAHAHRTPPRTYKDGRVEQRGGHEVLARGQGAYEVEELARMVLTDPRDPVQLITVWSEREEQWVTASRRDDL